MSKFKPNLISSNPKDGSFTKEFRDNLINSKGGIKEYRAILKKDGCRLELGLKSNPVGRSLKAPKSTLLYERFKKLNHLCIDLGIIAEGEFYMHGEKFNTIFSFFSNTDVTNPDYKLKLQKLHTNKPEDYKKKYQDKTVEFLTTFHDGLKFWLFDGIILDRPDLVGFEERMKEITLRLKTLSDEDLKHVEFPNLITFETLDELDISYEVALNLGWEGYILTHKDHQYKYGRNSIKDGTILKMKDENNRWDGVILDVEEGTNIKDGVEKTTNELGRSVTSGKKEDRESNGMAKGFVVQFEDKGIFTVGLKGFDNEAKKELLKNKQNYIGRNFEYVGMPPVKDFPRSVFFDCWRDEK